MTTRPIVQSLNYPAILIRQLETWLDIPLGGPTHREDRKYAERVLGAIRVAQHYQLDGPTLFGDNLKGLPRYHRLPFPSITISFCVNGLSWVICSIEWKPPSNSSRMVAEVAPGLNDDDRLFHTMAFARSPGGTWTPYPKVFTVSNELAGGSHPGFATCPLPIRSALMAQESGTGKADSADRQSKRAARFHGVVLELIEALSCSNVHAEPIQRVDAAVNARRVRDGKLPLYETRVLVVDAPRTVAGKSEAMGGHHASPRQHLRRGHIRIHPTAGKLWINSCVVGRLDKGIIDKTYLVRHKGATEAA